MIVRLDQPNQKVDVRVGDVVYDTLTLYGNGLQRFSAGAGDQPHAAVALEDAPAYDRTATLRVGGVPADPGGNRCGEQPWPTCGYVVGAIGRREDVSSDVAAKVAWAYHAQEKHLSVLPTRAGHWSWRQDIQVQTDALGRTYRVFLRGSCVRFVEFCHEEAQLPVVDLRAGEYLLSTYQLQAFHRGGPYPVRPAVGDALSGRWPDCLF